MLNVCYYNGELINNRKIISVYNGSFLYGVNCFEGIRGYWNSTVGKLILLDADHHIERLMESSDRLSFKHRYSKDLILSSLSSIVLKEEIKEDVYIRITLFIDGEGSWIESHDISYLISIRSMNSNLYESGVQSTYTLSTSTFLRISELSIPPSIKAGANYLNSRYAKLEALGRGFDDALIVNQEGFIAECSGSCIFFIQGEVLHTPSLQSDILPSITRGRIIKLCRARGIKVLERQIETLNLNLFDGAFLCGSMIEIMPVSQIDNYLFGTSELKFYRQVVDLFKASLIIENI